MLVTTEEMNEYRKKFHKHYYEKIAKDLAGFEGSRASELSKYNFWFCSCFVAGIIGLCVYIYFMNTLPKDVFFGVGKNDGVDNIIFMVTAIVISFLYYLAWKVKKNFEKKVKEGVIQSFLSFFGDFRWSMDENISQKELEASGLTDSITDMTSDDYFEGTYKDTKIIISEVKLKRSSGKNTSTIFEGLFIKVGMNKASKAHTIIVQDMTFNNWVEESHLPFDFPDKEKVNLEDPEFEKMFNVFSNDQIEARFILTTAFMQRLKNLKEIYHATSIRASIQGNSILIALPCKKDMFILGDVKKPVTDSGEVQTLFEEFAAVLSIVDILNLTSKTGL